MSGNVVADLSHVRAENLRQSLSRPILAACFNLGAVFFVPVLRVFLAPQ